MSRRALFTLISIACLGGAGAYVFHAAERASSPPASDRTASLHAVTEEKGAKRSDTPRQAILPDPTPLLTPGEALPTGPFLVFRHTAPDRYNGALGIAPLSDPEAPRFVPTLLCERLHMAAGRGVCLTAERGVFTSYEAVLFDETFNALGKLALAGAPSRVQVAPDGSLAATTVFITGHSYATVGFSTRTSIIDLRNRRWWVEDLETFTVRRQGRTLRSSDFNFWGVTFLPQQLKSDARKFYATLGTGGETFLVQGDADTHTVEVVEEDIECPSLSPNGRRLAFKHRDGGLTGPITWRLWVLDLDTRRRHPLAETRSVDDQAEWLDDEQLLYALPGGAESPATMDQWVVPADGGGTPRLVLPRAYSAVLVRGR